MINIFKKKPEKCKHKYKDFPWYISCTQDEDKKYIGKYKVQIIEPYVCLICKERVNKILYSKQGLRYTDAIAKVCELEGKYENKIKDAPVVEDMVNDFQLVDEAFIESYECSQKITSDIMKSIYNDKSTCNGSDDKNFMELINEIKNNLQVAQKGIN